MPYARPDLESLIEQAQSSLVAQLQEIDPNYTAVVFASMENILAITACELVDDQYSFLEYAFLNCTPFNAGAEYLEGWSALVGLTRNQAEAATGTVTFAGTSGTVVPSGSTLIGNGQQTYTTGAAYTVGTSSPVTITCTQTGSAGNAAAGMTLTLTTPISGLSSPNAATVSVITGGTAQETDDSLRTRMLYRYANQPSGGNVTDYVGWCLAVNGVTRAWCLPNYAPGIGAVTVLTMFDNSEAAYGGFPQGVNGTATGEYRQGTTTSTGCQLSVANYIFPLQPVTALVWSMSPIEQNIGVTLTGTGTTNTWTAGTWSTTPTTVQSGVLAALQDLVLRLGTATGGTIAVSDFYAAILSVAGAGSFTMTSPSSSVVTAATYLPVIFELSFTP